MKMMNVAAKSLKSRTLVTTMLGGLLVSGVLAATPANAAINPDTTTPGAIIDTSNTRPYWVGLGIRNEAGNSGGTCTGLLINPRVVLFAAHCVDGLAPAAYDGDTAGNRARVMYSTDPTFGNANLRNWLFSQDFGQQPGADGRTPSGQSVMVWFDPRSRFGPARPAGDGTFLPADVAIAGFNTANELLGRDAAGGIGLLFSPVTGTVNVTIGGYGQSGTEPGTTRVSDFQRRLGTNVMSFLGTSRDINIGFYGTAISNILSPGTQTFQDMYWADFDDPRRATRPFFNGPGTRPLTEFSLDPDIFPGNATANEVGTAPGDSGSPLITNAFGREVSLGVLSQGSRWFFESLGNPNDNAIRTCSNTNVGTNFACLGTAGGWNPLFLFWDQIVVNNPYKYVTVAAGDGEWTDATRWRQELDPLYFTLSGGTLVNGVPTTAALGVSDGAANVGTVRPNPSAPALCAFTGTCPPTGGTSEPLPGSVEVLGTRSAALPGQVDLAGARIHVNGTAERNREEGVGEFLLTDTDGANQTSSGEFQLVGLSADTAQSAEAPALTAPTDTANTTALWSSGTLIGVNSGALTGPGSSNFVANNVLGTAGLQNSTRWFEVNLRAAGTTFLTNANIEIDRLSVRGASSGLNIRSNGTLTTVMSSFVDAGMLTVDGRLTARQLTVGGGMVGGTGTIAARDGLLITGGVLTPGALGGGVGTLAVTGPTTFSGPGMLGIDLGSATSADRLNVTGTLALGGTFAVNTVGSYVPLFGSSWTVANATGGITGSFNNLVTNIPGVLRPETSVTGNDIILRITAVPYATFISATGSSEQLAIARALDQLRGIAGSGAALPLFTNLDPQSAAATLASIEAMKPSNALAGNQSLRMDNAVTATALFDRLTRVRTADRGTVTFNVAGAAGMASMTAAGMNGTTVAAMLAEAAETQGSSVQIAPEWSAFATVTYAYGNSNMQRNSTAEATGWTLTAGADRKISDEFILGFGASYTTGETELNLVGNSVDTSGWSVNGYAALDIGPGTTLDMWVRGGSGELETSRIQGVGATTFTSNATADTSSFAWGTTLTHNLAGDGPVTWSPVLSAVASKTTIDAYTETSSSASLRIDEREIDSLQFKAGLQASRNVTISDSDVRAYGRVSAVHDAAITADVVTARFVTGGPNALPFTITGVEPTTSFSEVAAGFTVQSTDTMTVSMEATQTLGRDELELGSVSLTGRIRF
jgi:uncharacterized protein with beta-barrel porin domain